MNDNGALTSEEHVAPWPEKVAMEEPPPPLRLRIRDRTEAIWSRVRHWHRLLPVILFLLPLCITLPRIDYPDRYLFDEILFAYTAGQYAENDADAYAWSHPCSTFKNDERCAEAMPEAVQEGGRIGKYQWDHPPLGKLIIAGGILVFGNDAFGWRITSAVFGAVGIVLVYYLGFMLAGRRVVGVLAASLLMLDGLYFVYSRMGLVDIYVTVIGLAAMLAFASYLRAPPDQARWPLFLTGILLGLGIATKWNAAYLAAGVGVVVLWRVYRLFRASRREDAPPEARLAFYDHLFFVPLALGFVPIAIYILSFTQFFLDGWSLSQFIELQKETFHVHSTIRDHNPMASKWWEWPLALRHVWFGTRSFADGRHATIYANGNPLLYWGLLPAIGWLCVYWWKRRSWQLIVLAIGFFGQWLPWILIERSTYTYHFLPAVPYGCIAVALAVTHLCRGNTGWRRVLAVEYVVLIALAFAFFYPIYSYYPLSDASMALRMWLPTWR